MENGKQPAFPLSAEAEQQIREGYGFLEIGLTKREYFAVLAMQAFITNGTNFSDISMHSVEIADELLKQLEK